MKYQLLVIVLLGLSLAPAGAGSAAANISGTWKGAIDRPGNSYGPLDITFIIKQDGEKLTGTYRDGTARREPRIITGTVNGNKVIFSYEDKPPAEIKKPGLTVTFNGTLESPTKITGVIGTPYCHGECQWTVTKQKK
jgi:hypothetical protein